MNFLDRAISAISPKWGARRAAWRGMEERARGYDAAQFDARNLNWSPVNEPAEAILSREGDILRARARDMEMNSDIVNAAISAVTRNVLGLGYRLQAQTPRGRLNDEIEARWIEWCKPHNCDVTGMSSFTALLEMMLRRKIVDGGILINKTFTSGGVCPFKLQLLEVDYLTSPMTPQRGRNQVIRGIEVDRYLRTRGYWVQPFVPDGVAPAEPTYIPAKNMLFYFTKHRPTQVREVTDLAPVLERVRDVNEWVEAVSEKQRAEACYAVYITRENPAPGYGRGTFRTDEKSRRAAKDGYSLLRPGMIFDLSPGESMGALNPTGQGADAAQFLRIMMRLIGSGMGLSYESLSRDMSGMSYSSARQGAIEDEVSFAAARVQIEEIMREIYETFLISCYRSGVLDMPHFWERKQEYFAHEWIRIPKKWVDPLKEAQANIQLLQAGIKTYPQIVAETGLDYKEAIDTIAEVVDYGDSKGIDMRGLIYDGKITEQDQEPEQSAGQTAEEPGTTGAPGADTDAASGPEGAADAGTDAVAGAEQVPA